MEQKTATNGGVHQLQCPSYRLGMLQWNRRNSGIGFWCFLMMALGLGKAIGFSRLYSRGFINRWRDVVSDSELGNACVLEDLKITEEDWALDLRFYNSAINKGPITSVLWNLYSWHDFSFLVGTLIHCSFHWRSISFYVYGG